MNKGFRQGIVNIAEICAQKEIADVIISPGSRSAPLTLAFLRHPELTCRTIVDERSAAFIALGLAQQTRRPVGLVCTSGTAGLNYSPAVAEAYYQEIPLLLFTADRPPEWIDQNDNQTIRQQQMYGGHCRGFFELPVDDSPPDAAWHLERIISDAVSTSLFPVPGPVHINVPLREPLYPESEFSYKKDAKVVSLTPSERSLSESVWQELASVWDEASKKLIVAGMHNPDPKLSKSLRELQQNPSVSVICDVTSNLSDASKIQHSDMFLGSGDLQVCQDLVPDLLLSFGGPVVSKNLKLFLRERKPRMHWQLQSSPQSIDTFQALTRIIPVSADYFFENLRKRLAANEGRSPGEFEHSYAGRWQAFEEKALSSIKKFLAEIPHCEFSAMNTILNRLPPQSHVQLGNSFIVRMANFLGAPDERNVKVNSNRGTSGIDGTLGTAVGAALATSKITTFIAGDLAFFYDRNALWHKYVPPNLRIVIINNQGGGIFRILDGARSLPELDQHFEVEHNLTAKNTAEDHNLSYMFCDSAENLEACLSEFFKPSDKAGILEVHTDKNVNAETFLQFKSIMKELK